MLNQILFKEVKFTLIQNLNKSNSLVNNFRKNYFSFFLILIFFLLLS